MHLLPLLVGVTVVILNMLIQPLTAEMSTEAPPAGTSLCGLKIGDTCCRTWEEFSQVLRHLLSSKQQCLKKKTISALDRMLRTDVIPLMGGVELVRYATLLPPGNGSASYNRSALSGEEGWGWQVLSRVADLCRTHVIRLRIEQVEGRARHHYKHLFPLMMFAFMKMLVILVPLGFQFMAVISGKALLLSKMALALASAQAMKKVTSAWFDVYHPPHPPYYHHVHRSYHSEPDLLHAATLQGLQPSLMETSHPPTFTQTSPDIGPVPYHPAPHFMFTDADRKPIQYPPVPSVYDPPNEAAEDHADRRYGNGNMNHHQHNRRKRL